MAHLVLGQQSRVDFVHMHLSRHALGVFFLVAGEHHGAADAQALEAVHGLHSAGLYRVLNDQIARILAVHGGIDAVFFHFSGLPARGLFHQPGVAQGHLAAIHQGFHAVARLLVGLGEPGVFDGAAIGGADGLGDGMQGQSFRMGGQLEQLFFIDLFRLHARHGHAALGEGARLIKDHRIASAQGFQQVAALDQDAVFGGAADARVEGEGHGQHQGAGAGDDQEDQRPAQPKDKGLARHQGRNDAQQHRQQAHDGRIPMSETADEALGAGLALTRLLHQLQDAGNGALRIGARGADAQGIRQVDAAADDRIAGIDRMGRGLAGERRSIQRGAAADDLAVQGHALAGTHHQDIPRVDFFGRNSADLAILLHVGVVGADVHQVAHGVAALVHGGILKELADLVEQHDGHGLGIFADAQRADGGDGHEEGLVKDLVMEDALHRARQGIIAHHQIGRQEGEQPGYPLRGQQPGDDQQRRARDDADQHGLALAFLAFAVMVAAAAAVIVAMAMVVIMMMLVLMLVMMMFVLVIVTHDSVLPLFLHVLHALAEQGAHVFVCQSVKNDFALPAIAHQLGLAQNAQLMGHGGYRHAQEQAQVAHAHLGHQQHKQDAAPGAVPQDLEQLADIQHGVIVRQSGSDLGHGVRMGVLKGADRGFFILQGFSLQLFHCARLLFCKHLNICSSVIICTRYAGVNSENEKGNIRQYSRNIFFSISRCL